MPRNYEFIFQYSSPQTVTALFLQLWYFVRGQEMLEKTGKMRKASGNAVVVYGVAHFLQPGQ